MTYEEIESYAIMHILESDSTEAVEKNAKMDRRGFMDATASERS